MPLTLPGIVIKNVYFAIRDKSTNEYVVDFDKEHKSTLLSSDNNGMYFKLDASNLIAGRSYVIDILIANEQDDLFQNVSPVFSVHT